MGDTSLSIRVFPAACLPVSCVYHSSNAGGLERGSQSGGGYGAEGGFDADFETLSGGAPNSGVFDADYINSAQQQTVLDDGGVGGTFVVNSSEGGRMNSPFSNSTNFQSNYGGLSPGGGGLPNVSLSGTAEALLALSKPDPELLLGISEEGSLTRTLRVHFLQLYG